MHRHHPFGERAERIFMHMAGKFGGRGGGGFGPFGHGGRGGGRGGPGDMFRAGRMLADGDLKLITLSLLGRGAAPRLRHHQGAGRAHPAASTARARAWSTRR